MLSPLLLLLSLSFLFKYKAWTLPPIRNDSPELLMMNGGDVIVPVASSPSDEFCHRQGELTFLEESINQLPWWPAWPGKSGLPPYMGWWRNALPCLSQLSAPFSKVKTGQSEKKKRRHIHIGLYFIGLLGRGRDISKWLPYFLRITNRLDANELGISVKYKQTWSIWKQKSTQLREQVKVWHNQ